MITLQTGGESEMKDVLVSIVVPIYNQERYLHTSIPCLMEQSYKNIEIILVNDGSTDSSKEIIENYSKVDKRICCVDKKNGGLVDATIAGIQASRGRYIAFLDPDDRVGKDFISRFIDELDQDYDFLASGFYYDFDVEKPFTEEDKSKIEEEMKKIIKENLAIERFSLPKEKALELMKDQPYKQELINDLADGEEISFYKQGDFTDLCAGPHLESTGKVKVVKILSSSGAYWRGDEHNKMLQRIYAISFPKASQMDEYMQKLEEARARDHRKLGKELELFMTSPLVGSGLPMYLPNGATVRRLLERYIQDKEIEMGYQHVYTPSLANTELYKVSGHWDHYKEDMFPVMKMDNEEMVLRPMNCPHHMMIYANRLHSYKDLPIRIGEIAHDFRYESSGTLKGIERGRHFCQNDAHLFVTPEQIESEFAKVVDLIFETYKDFNITDYRCVLSLRDPEDKVKYHDDDEMWNKAEDALRTVLNDLGIEYTEEIGEAAFYGPKLDVNVKPAIGNEYTLSTCQLDFCLPSKFNLTYIDKDGQRKTPVVLHRAILGSLDRFMAYILEETKGNLPLWLAPVQATILPVKNEDEELNAYAHGLYDYLADNGIRVEIDERAEKLGYRVREAQVKKIPYLIVLGKNEAAEGTVSYRLHGEQKSTTVSKDEFVAMLKDEIATKKNNPAAATERSVTICNVLCIVMLLVYISENNRKING